MKVSIHTASHIDTRLAVAGVRDRDGVRVRVRISYSQASRVYQPRMAIHTATDEASRVYSRLKYQQKSQGGGYFCVHPVCGIPFSAIMR